MNVDYNIRWISNLNNLPKIPNLHYCSRVTVCINVQRKGKRSSQKQNLGIISDSLLPDRILQIKVSFVPTLAGEIPQSVVSMHGVHR